jgi:ligand-binding sensor domain-containing protein
MKKILKFNLLVSILGLLNACKRDVETPSPTWEKITNLTPQWANVAAYVQDWSVDSQNRIWIITNDANNLTSTNRDVWQLSGVNWQYFETLANAEPENLYLDKEDIKWFTSLNRLYKVSPSGHTSFDIPSQYYRTGWASKILDIDHTETIWLWHYDKILQFKAGNWSVYQDGVGLIDYLLADKKGNIWVSSPDKIYNKTQEINSIEAQNLANANQKQTLTFNQGAKQLFRGKNDEIYFLIANQIILFDGNKWFYLPMPTALGSLSAKSIALDQQNNVWLASSIGVFQYRDNQWINHTNMAARRILVDRQNQKWIMSIDDNLYRFKE